MKHLFFTLLFILPITLNAQQNNPTEINTYLKKSNTKRKTGNALLITGGGLILTGVIVASTGNRNNSWYYFLSANELAGAAITSLGVLTALTSVPFYISAHHNRKKSLSISPTTGIIPSNSVIGTDNYAVIGVKINF